MTLFTFGATLYVQYMCIYYLEFVCTKVINSDIRNCQVLSDDKKRALYDQYGEAGVKSTVGGPGGYTVFP